MAMATGSDAEHHVVVFDGLHVSQLVIRLRRYLSFLRGDRDVVAEQGFQGNMLAVRE
jgi:hypothetical protein